MHGYGNADGLATLRRLLVEQIVKLFQYPPPHFQQVFPDIAFVFRHVTDLSRRGHNCRLKKVDLRGLEPLTSTMPLWRSPN